MPLTRKQFELGINKDIEEWMRRIYHYLSQHQDKAFSREELAEALGAKEPFPPPILRDIPVPPPLSYTLKKDFETAFEKLLWLEVIAEGVVDNVRYYALGRRPLKEYLDE